MAALNGVLLAYPPYYRSSYVAVQRVGDEPIGSLDDPRLRELCVGIELVGDDSAGTPPALALARRSIIDKVSGFSILGDYGTPNPPARIVEAVAEGRSDIALAGGPMAGYFAAPPPAAARGSPPRSCRSGREGEAQSGNARVGDAGTRLLPPAAGIAHQAKGTENAVGVPTGARYSASSSYSK